MTAASTRRLIVTWLVGTIIGTLLIAVTSPLFVRSYLRRDIDAVRGVRAMPAGSVYRWRREGFANTRIGPFGMPGKLSIAPRDSSSGAIERSKRIALWGDSQAEGISVADDRKLFAQIEQRSNGALEVFPLAQSGDDLADWLVQIPSVERELAIDMHAILIVDLPDLMVDPNRVGPTDRFEAVTNLPAFVIQSARNLIVDAESGEPRQLRWKIGPTPRARPSHADRAPSDQDWQPSMRKLREATDRPILLIYAPPLPSIIGGRSSFVDREASEFDKVRRAAERQRIRVINLHQPLCESARQGRWPHGFHNGQIGTGHLNADGYRVIASSVVESATGPP